MNFLRQLPPKVYAWLICLGFAAVFASISLYNHSIYRSYAYDLGIKNQALYDYAHLRYNYNTVMPELHGEVNILANHFEPVLFLFGPLYYIFGGYTLLIVQMIFILAGGWAVYLWLRAKGQTTALSLIAMACYYSLWGVYSALSYDFHTNVLGAMLVPWIFYGIERKRWIIAIVAGFLMVNCKENMALWGFFIGTGMAWHFRKEAAKRWFSLGFGVFSLLYFVCIMKLLMPYYADGQLEYMHFQYSALGENPSEVVRTIFQRPLHVFRLFFENHLPEKNIYNEQAKWELHETVLLSGGVFMLLRPQFLWMMIPVYGQKLFSDDAAKWGVHVHYSIEFVPVLVLAAFSFFAGWKSSKAAALAGFVLLLSCLDVTKNQIDVWKPVPSPKTVIRFYSPAHYRREFDVKELRKALKENLRPEDAVSAISYVVPHVANRKKVYQFPDMKEANVLVLVNDGTFYYPTDSMGFSYVRDTMRTSEGWEAVYNTEKIQIFRKR